MAAMPGFAAISHPTLAAIRPGATQDARQSHVAWETQRGIPETPSMLYYRGRLCLLRDGGVLTCLEAATGKELFRARIGASGQYIASPIAAGDRIVAASVPGVVTILQAADELKVLARNDLGEKIFLLSWHTEIGGPGMTMADFRATGRPGRGRTGKGPGHMGPGRAMCYGGSIEYAPQEEHPDRSRPNSS